MKDKRISVKLTFPHEWPLFRQTPGGLGKWENYDFFLNDDIVECDFWVIFSKYNLKKTKAVCAKTNVIFMPCEAYSIERFSNRFLKQFAQIITCQTEIKHQNKALDLAGHPWFVGKSYDELIKLESVKKDKKISLITSNKVQTEGHRKRLDFANKLKDHFKDKIDLYGRGIRDFNDKWDVLAPYEFSIAIENDNCNDWLTEKFYDCHLAYTFPFYYGCPNAETYFDEKSFCRIDIDDFKNSVEIIENVLSIDNFYEENIQHLKTARELSLNKYNLFPLIVKYLEKMNPHAQKSEIMVTPESRILKWLNI